VNAFVHDKRGSMTEQRIARIFAANNGHCHVCKRKLYPADDYEIDHIIALENGGTDDDANLAPCCEGCHILKTAGDHSTAGYSRRVYTKHVVPKSKRKPKWRR